MMHSIMVGIRAEGEGRIGGAHFIEGGVKSGTNLVLSRGILLGASLIGLSSLFLAASSFRGSPVTLQLGGNFG